MRAARAEEREEELACVELVLHEEDAQLTKLSKEQAAYIGVPVQGPYKPDTYRY